MYMEAEILFHAIVVLNVDASQLPKISAIKNSQVVRNEKMAIPRRLVAMLLFYSRVQKSIENFVFRPKMAIFRRVGMREGGLPLPLAFQYLILMI